MRFLLGSKAKEVVIMECHAQREACLLTALQQVHVTCLNAKMHLSAIVMCLAWGMDMHPLPPSKKARAHGGKNHLCHKLAKKL